MGKIGDLWVKLKLKDDEYRKGLDDAKGQTKTFSEGLKKLSTAAVAVWGMIGAAATKMALDFVKSSQTMGDAWDIVMTQISTRWQQIRAELNRGIAEGGFKGFVKAFFSDTGEGAALKAGEALSQAKDAMTEIDYAFRLSMAQTEPKLHELYLKMMNSALSASDREAAAVDYRKTVEAIYAPRVKGLSDIMQKTVEQYLVIGGMDASQYSASQTIDLIKMMASDPQKVEKEYNDFYKGYQSIGDTVSANLVATMEAYYNATNEMNSILKRADRTAQTMQSTGLDDLIKKLGTAGDSMTAFRTRVSEEAEVMASDEEFQRTNDPLEDFEKSHAEILDRLNHKQRVFADLAREAFKDASEATENYKTETQNALDLADDAAQTALNNLQKDQERAAELIGMLRDAITESLYNSTQTITDALTGLEDIDSGTLAKAILQPFADMAKQMGAFIIAEGTAIIAAKAAVKNPYTAIAAGAALIALSAAMTSGLNAIASSTGGSSSAMSSGGSSAGTPETSTINTEMTIYVKGKISGRDILISGEKSKKYYDR